MVFRFTGLPDEMNPRILYVFSTLHEISRTLARENLLDGQLGSRGVLPTEYLSPGFSRVFCRAKHSRSALSVPLCSIRQHRIDPACKRACCYPESRHGRHSEAAGRRTSEMLSLGCYNVVASSFKSIYLFRPARPFGSSAKSDNDGSDRPRRYI